MSDSCMVKTDKWHKPYTSISSKSLYGVGLAQSSSISCSVTDGSNEPRIINIARERQLWNYVTCYLTWISSLLYFQICRHSNAVFCALYRKYQFLIMNSIPKQLSLDRIVPSKSTWANAKATKPHQYLLLIGREMTKIIQLREPA